MTDHPFNQGGLLTATLTPIRLHPDECILRVADAIAGRWVCVRPDHTDRVCEPPTEACLPVR